MKRVIAIVFAGMLLMSGCQESLENRCERECREYTAKKCPSHLVKDIVIDSLTFDKASHIMTFWYTLSGVMDNGEVLGQHDIRGMLLKELKNNAQMQLYKDAGYGFRYVYYSAKEKGTQLFEATFQKKDYQ